MQKLKFLENRWVKLLAEVVPWLVGVYTVVIKRLFDWSFTAQVESLTSKYIESHPSAYSNIIIIIASAIVSVCLLFKLLIIIREKLDSSSVVNIEPEEICAICSEVNAELNNNIENVRNDPRAILESSRENKFSHNVKFIMERLHSHLRRSLKLAPKDIFISLYCVNNFSKGNYVVANTNHKLQRLETTKLNYFAHLPAHNRHRPSKHIDYSISDFQKYECHKALSNNQLLYCKFDTKDLFRSSNSSRKKVRHLYCIHLQVENKPIALLNIEILNKSAFNNIDEMEEYLAYNVRTFTLLLEYQFLRSRLVTLFNQEPKS